MKQLRIFVVGAVFVLVAMLALASGRLQLHHPSEQAVAHWNDGTEAFYRQVVDSDGDWLENTGKPVFDNQEVSPFAYSELVRLVRLASLKDTSVMGMHVAADGSEKWIEVVLDEFKLNAWEGDRKVFEFPVSTGRPGYNTPRGEYRVWRKVLTQAYRGGSRERGDYYYLPNVPFSLFFGGGRVANWRGYAIHGAYWHNDFGIKNRSAGCVNMHPEDAASLYYWASPAIPDGVNAINATPENPGVRVVIR